jgi:hypothetical protein
MHVHVSHTCNVQVITAVDLTVNESDSTKVECVRARAHKVVHRDRTMQHVVVPALCEPSSFADVMLSSVNNAVMPFASESRRSRTRRCTRVLSA